MSDDAVDQSRRTWIAMSCGAGAVGGVAAAVPFVASMQPSERARAAGAPVSADISALQPSQQMIVAWRGKPVFIVRRTEAQLAELPKLNSELADPLSKRTNYSVTPPYARNDWRSIKPEFLVVVGICTHLGCTPLDKFTPGAQPSLPKDWPGGYLCPCHGSKFDMAARVFKDMPAPDNLEVPPYKYLSDTVVLIGDDSKA